MVNDKKVTSGVQELIKRLKDDGVKAGRDEAHRIIKEAQENAASLINRAREETEELLAATRAEIEAEKKTANESLKMALRDTELMLESKLKARFTDHVRHLVTRTLDNKEFLMQLILAIAGKSCSRLSEHKDLDLLVAQDKLDHLVLEISGDVLREGVDIVSSAAVNAGIRIRMKGENAEIDLSDNAISEILLKFLLPKYRAILAGVE